MNETEEILKKIFDLYFEEEYYSNKIHDDQDYINITDDIEKLQKRLSHILKPVLNDEQIYLIINDFESLYTTMCNIYRYYDFIQGLSLGITLTTVSPKLNNPSFVEQIVKIVNQTNR